MIGSNRFNETIKAMKHAEMNRAVLEKIAAIDSREPEEMRDWSLRAFHYQSVVVDIQEMAREVLKLR